MRDETRLPTSIAAAAAVHAALLCVNVARPARQPYTAPLPPVEVDVVAVAPPPVVAQQPPVTASIAPPAAPAAPLRAPRPQAPRPAATPGPATSPAIDLAAIVAATDGLLVTLSQGGGAGDDGDGAGAGETIVPPVPLADYARAKVTYPDAAIDALVAGEVLLALRVDEHGAVSDVEVLRRAGYGFDELAAELARGYRFRPGRDAAWAPVATRIGWRMAFAKWRPAPGGLQPAPAASTTGMVALDAPPPPRQPQKPARVRGAERSIASLSTVERRNLCRWRIEISGGTGPHRCEQRDSWERELQIQAQGWGRRARLRGERHAEPVVVVPSEDECVVETRRYDACGATAGEYVACFAAVAREPCALRPPRACEALARCS